MTPKHVRSDRLFAYIKGVFVGVMNVQFNSVRIREVNNVKITTMRVPICGDGR